MLKPPFYHLCGPPTNGCSDGNIPNTNPPDTDPIEQLEGELYTVPASYERLRICCIHEEVLQSPALQDLVSACVPHAHFYTASLSSPCSEYTHKVEKVVTLTPESPPCMVTPTTANIHELKAVRLVTHVAQNGHMSPATKKSDYSLPSLCTSSYLIPGFLNSPFYHHPLPPCSSVTHSIPPYSTITTSSLLHHHAVPPYSVITPSLPTLSSPHPSLLSSPPAVNL